MCVPIEPIKQPYLFGMIELIGYNSREAVNSSGKKKNRRIFNIEMAILFQKCCRHTQEHVLKSRVQMSQWSCTDKRRVGGGRGAGRSVLTVLGMFQLHTVLITLARRPLQRSHTHTHTHTHTHSLTHSLPPTHIYTPFKEVNNNIKRQRKRTFINMFGSSLNWIDHFLPLDLSSLYYKNEVDQSLDYRNS